MKRPLLYTSAVLFVLTTGLTVFAVTGGVHMKRGYVEILYWAILLGFSAAFTAFAMHYGFDFTNPSARQRRKWQPIELLHGLQGWPPPGPNCFRWQGGHLHYSSGKWVTPTPAQWEEFWRVCDEIDVWSWPPAISNPELTVIDGLSSYTELKIGSRYVASIGQVVGSPPDFPEKLMRLHRALQALAGWNRPTDAQYSRSFYNPACVVFRRDNTNTLTPKEARQRTRQILMNIRRPSRRKLRRSLPSGKLSTVNDVKAATQKLSPEEQWELYRWLGESGEVQRFRREELRRESAIGIEQADKSDIAPLEIDALKEEVHRRLNSRAD